MPAVLGVVDMSARRMRPTSRTPRVNRQGLRNLLEALEAHGCEPRQVGPRRWVAQCPACRAKGRSELLVIAVCSDGRFDMRCAA